MAAAAMVGLFVAATAGQPAVLAAAVVMLGLVSLSMAGGTVRLKAAQSLRFALEFPEGDDCIRGSPLPVELLVIHRDARPLGEAEIRLRGEGFRPVESVQLRLPGLSKTRALFDVIYPRAGRWRFHGVDLHLRGFLGLSTAVVYRACEAPVKVRPKTVGRVHLHTLTRGIGIERDRSGRFLSRRLGAGLELRELREYVPGDPLKSVAWRAT